MQMGALNVAHKHTHSALITLLNAAKSQFVARGTQNLVIICNLVVGLHIAPTVITRPAGPAYRGLANFLLSPWAHISTHTTDAKAAHLHCVTKLKVNCLFCITSVSVRHS